MAVLSPLLSSSSPQYTFPSLSSLSPNPTLTLAPYRYRSRLILSQVSHHHQPPPVVIDRSLLNVSEAKSESELWAAASLRVRTFYVTHNDSINIEEHKKYLAEREFEALKERIAGKRLGFGRVSCINATVPLSQVSSVPLDLCTSYKCPDNMENRVVIGSLDLNQCISLPDEIVGMKPKNCYLRTGGHEHQLKIYNLLKDQIVAEETSGKEIIKESETTSITLQFLKR
nr:Histone acetyltransferase [Ipomoea batatas]